MVRRYVSVPGYEIVVLSWTNLGIDRAQCWCVLGVAASSLQWPNQTTLSFTFVTVHFPDSK